MTTDSNNTGNTKHSPPSDVCLLLRSHAEARWLIHKVLPVLREFEHNRPVTEDQLGPGLAYLEVLWIEACGRAAETDAARVELDDSGSSGDRSLYEKAHRYHAAVQRLRKSIARRITRLLAVPRNSPRDCSTRRTLRDRPANR